MLRLKGNSQSQADLNRTIGTVLRERRESLGLSWEDISREIHIQVKYLRALEDGHTNELPDSVYFRMFAKAYAEQMGLSFRKVVAVIQENPPGLVRSYAPASPIALESESAAGLAAEEFKKSTVESEASTGSGPISLVRAGRSPRRNKVRFSGVSLAHSVSWGTIVRYSMIGAGALLIGFVIKYAAVNKGFARSSGPDEITLEQAVIPSSGEGFGAKGSALPVQPLRLEARATADVDLRVLGDSNTLYDEELESGEVLNFEAHYVFEITASNQDRIELFIDNQPLIGLPSENGRLSSVEITQFNYKEFLEAEKAKIKQAGK